MSLSDEELQLLVKMYLEKSLDTLEDARCNKEMRRWNSAANRLYYALFHAVTALFVSDGLAVSSHNGARTVFGREYVLTGLATDEEARLFSQMETMRERADYDATFKAGEELVFERFILVEKMINHIIELINRER